MAGIKSLAKDTVIYGSCTILGRFLNWLLVPLYSILFLPEKYGIVSNLYSYTAVALVILNYGMETGFFRYANKEGQDPAKVYSTALVSVGFTSLLFIVLVSIFIGPVSDLLLYPDHQNYVWMLAVIVGIDAFANIPFAYLRYKNRPIKFAAIKIGSIVVNIGLNLFLLLACPEIAKSKASWLINWFYEPMGGVDFGIGWIFVSNIISTVFSLVCLLPYFATKISIFDGRLMKKMFLYSWPLLVLGVAGVLSQNMGQIIIPYLFEGQKIEADKMVGIYSANIKIAIIMVMFTNAFRYAYEPFIFTQGKKKGENPEKIYSDSMKYFIIFGLFIFLGVMFFLPIIRYFIAEEYWSGLQVVPIMMVAELLFGIFYNLSIWYKLTDRTRWGMYFSLTCFVIILGLNIWFVPTMGIINGYVGSAWAAVIGYLVVMLLSYFIGQHYYPINYPLKKIGLYTALAAILYVGGQWLECSNVMLLTYANRTLLLLIYILVVYILENRTTSRPSPAE